MADLTPEQRRSGWSDLERALAGTCTQSTEHGHEFDRWLAERDNAPAPTARQLVALEQYVNEARLRHGVDVHLWDSYGWQRTYQDESRPGRGHNLNTTWTDGERIVATHLDVYGFGSKGVGDVD